MKYLFSALLMFTMLTVSSAQKTEEKKMLPVDMQFNTEHIDLGEVKRGEKRTFQYEFINSGRDTIEIDVVSGCDCTTLDWTRGKFAPGEGGVVDVIFDSTEKEKSETVDVDIYLKNIDPTYDAQYLFVLDYTFKLLE